MRFTRTLAALGLVIAALGACDPKTGGKPSAADGGGGRGYTLRLDVFGKNGKQITRPVDCTITGYADDKVVTVDGSPQVNKYRNLPTPYKLKILDLAEVTEIEFMCAMEGLLGDEFLCTVTTLAGGPARFIGEVFDRDLIGKADMIGTTGIATCTGRINARS